MTDLSSKLLATAREGLTPDAAVAARVRARVAAAVAAGAAAGAVASTAQAASTATTTGSIPVIATPALAPVATSVAAPVAGGLGLAAKLGGVLLAIGVVAATVTVVSSRTRTVAITAPDVSAVTAASSDEPAPDVHVAAPAEAAPAPNAGRPAMPAPPRTASVEPASLSREVELIDRAMLALRRGDARAALAAIDAFEVETRGQGQMAEDAAAVAIEARCRLGEDVSDRLARFDRAWPSSAQRERLQTACYSRR